MFVRGMAGFSRRSNCGKRENRPIAENISIPLTDAFSARRIIMVRQKLFRCSSVNHITMKTSAKVGLLSPSVLVLALFTGCNSVSVPAASKGYSIRAGDYSFWATKVKIHGSWAEVQTAEGPVWVSGAVITPKN